jgi:chromosome segregation ATPase
VVVVVAPSGRDGPERLRQGGARVIVVGATVAASELVGFDARPGLPTLPLPDASTHAVVCIEAWGGLDAARRTATLAEARRVLVPDGLCIVWSRSPRERGDAGVDFWTLEREVAATFDQVQMFAQLPWRGVSLAPVLDDDRALGVVVREGLLAAPPEATHYLAIGAAPAGRDRLAQAVQCVLVPLSTDPGGEGPTALFEAPTFEPAPPAIVEREPAVDRESIEREAIERERQNQRKLERDWQAEREATARERRAEREAAAHERQVDREAAAREHAEQHTRLVERVEQAERELAAARQEVAAAEAMVGTQRNDLTILTRSLRELEQAAARDTERAGQRERELDERNAAIAGMRARIEALLAERDTLARQLEVSAVERESARNLSVRLETEVELARKRAGASEDRLAERIAEASRLGADVSMLRERAEHQERALALARQRADELSATAALSVEQGRMQAEIAFDRDRLREELARRTAALEKLEERMWATRDEAQRERIELVKQTSELERVREQLDRARAIEVDKGHDIERLGAELRRLEVERSEMLSAIRSRDEELARLRRELDAMASRSDDLQRLRGELDARGMELAEASTRLEQALGRERDAQQAAKRREQQLVEAGAELERLRAEAEQSRGFGRGLQSELDVRLVELEQLAASVGDLQAQVETARVERREHESRAAELQHQLEQLAAERDVLRRHLREREQELDDVASAQESSGAELFLLRRELEATAEANERLADALRRPGAPGGGDGAPQTEGWPVEAVAEVMRLRGELEAALRAAAPPAREGAEDGGDRTRWRRLQLELEIRAREHEHVLAQLDGAEQRIWEMSDASDRNAARLAAGLAQLEKQRELFDETLEELEVTRNLLAAAQARGIEQSRLLASERAKLARLGMSDAAPRLVEPDGIEDLFAELDAADRTGDVQPILLPTAATLAQVAGDRRTVDERRTDRRPAATDAGVPAAVGDTPSSSGSRPIDLTPPGSPRVVVEPLGDDGWREGD